MPGTTRVDVAIVGGGHNALVAAAYLARAGLEVVVLERLEQLGGAAVSAYAFDGMDARLSRYSYLVSLLPQRIIDDLGLNIRLLRRRYSSYTPVPGETRGLLIDNGDADATRRSFERVGAASDVGTWGQFSDETGRLARALFPTVCDPLLTRGEARRLVGDEAVWSSFIERPVGETIAARFSHDLVRGVAYTDALIGTFASTIDASLDANRCFLYHVIGGGTGDWDVPVGGMGTVSGELARSARDAGARLLTGAEVASLTPDGEVRYRHGDEEFVLAAETVLSGVAQSVLERLLERTPSASDAATASEGAQVKVNLLLRRLPRLLDDSLDPAAAFGGTFHVNEGWGQLDYGYRSAVNGAVADPVPCEIYSHSLTDPSILSPELQRSGAQTLTVFGLQLPHRLTKAAVDAGGHAAFRRQLQDAVLASVSSVLAEPLADLLLSDARGEPCIETKTTLDLEDALGLPGGNIFHGPLDWPFAEDDAPLDTPARAWGVATDDPRILLCGSGAQRGGAVSGIGGHNAAMAVLQGQ